MSKQCTARAKVAIDRATEISDGRAQVGTMDLLQALAEDSTCLAFQALILAGCNPSRIPEAIDRIRGQR